MPPFSFANRNPRGSLLPKAEPNWGPVDAMDSSPALLLSQHIDLSSALPVVHSHAKALLACENLTIS